MLQRFLYLWRLVGPGLLFAGAAIGVSHLVQSTRAGANYGFSLFWVVLLIHFVKYPFFVIASYYVAGTGNNLLRGYWSVGRWAFWLVILVSLLSMFTIQAAVTLVTAGLVGLMTKGTFSLVVCSFIVLTICFCILILGRYAYLDQFIKWIIVFLSLATVASFLIAYWHGPVGLPDFQTPSILNFAGFSFLIAFMGWMPAPLDISIWNSIWCEEKNKIIPKPHSLKESLFDFNVGYFFCILLALLFVGLGALLMFGTGESFSPSGVLFSKQIVSLYTKTLGSWSYPIILLAALLAMFSTTLTCLDAFPRVFKEALLILRPKIQERGIYTIWLSVVVVGSMVLICFFLDNMKALVDLATILSFVSAPVFAYMNYRTIQDPHVNISFQLPRYLQVWSWFGIVFLSLFSVVFIIWRFFY